MTDFHTNHKRMNRTRDRLQEFRDLSRQYGGRGGWWKFRQRGVSKDEDVFLHQLKSKVGALERQAESVDPLGMTATIRILKELLAMAIPPKEELHRIHSVQVERARSILAGFVREHPVSEKQPSASTSRGLEAEFSEMESSMLQVRDLFTQISLLVMTQGSALDTIDAHVQQSQRIVMDGQSKLATASKKKKRRRKTKVVLSSLITVSGTIILLVLFL